MIGFDKRGNAKVWLNSNFAKNHINPFDVLRANRESVMVKNIFDIFKPYGYQLDMEMTTFAEMKKIVLGKIMNQPLENVLGAITWKQRTDIRSKKAPTPNQRRDIQP